MACRQGFAGVVVACEPTGHRWRVLVEQASGLGLELVCVQPLLVRRAREAEDFTRDKSDDKDALLIARLMTQLHCYLPERPTAAWARLRHLGNRRVEQLTGATAAQQRLRDLLECGIRDYQATGDPLRDEAPEPETWVAFVHLPSTVEPILGRNAGIKLTVTPRT